MACIATRREQINALATGSLAAEPARDLLTHLEACRECSEEFDLVADLLRARPAEKAAGQEPASQPVLRLWRPLLALAAVLVAALLIREAWWGDSRSLRDLAQITPIAAPESLLRGSPGERGSEFARGMAAYARGNFATAAKELRVTATRRPEDALAQLYLGIAELQTGATKRAMAPLRKAAALGTGLVAERGLWFLANASLQLGSDKPALAALETLRQLDGDYAANAEELLRALRDR